MPEQVHKSGKSGMSGSLSSGLAPGRRRCLLLAWLLLEPLLLLVMVVLLVVPVSAASAGRLSPIDCSARLEVQLPSRSTA